MSRKISFVLAGACTLGLLIILLPFGKAQTVGGAYQGQNTNRFQMFFSPLVRADTYLVDTSTGAVRQMQQASNGNTVFHPLLVEDAPLLPISGSSSTGRYRIYFSPLVREDTFLVDTANGRIWQMFKDSTTDEEFFRPRTLQEQK